MGWEGGATHSQRCQQNPFYRLPNPSATCYLPFCPLQGLVGFRDEREGEQGMRAGIGVWFRAWCQTGSKDQEGSGKIYFGFRILSDLLGRIWSITLYEHHMHHAGEHSDSDNYFTIQTLKRFLRHFTMKKNEVLIQHWGNFLKNHSKVLYDLSFQMKSSHKNCHLSIFKKLFHQKLGLLFFLVRGS